MSTATLPAPVIEPPAPSPARDVASVPVVAALLAVLAGVVAAALYLVPQAPAEGSADAGFARDMSAHHAQAVAMAETIRDRTGDPELRRLAADIALTQQSQIGRMSAWLDDWGLPQTAGGPRMAWMGTPMTGLMPGMATAQETAALATLPVADAEAAFLRQMVAHHTGGVAMAQAGAGLVEEPQVRALAEGIAAAQTSEIEYLQSLLAARGLPPAEVPETTEHGASAGGHEGASGPGLREAALLAVVTLGLVALLWLLLDSVVRRVGGRQAPVGPLAAVLVLSAGVTAAVHLALTPDHAREQALYGLFFLLTAVVAAAGAAMVLAGAQKTGAGVIAGVSLLLVVTYVVFRVVPPPGASAPEGVDAWGVVAVLAELVALVAAAVLLQPTRDRAGAPADA